MIVLGTSLLLCAAASVLKGPSIGLFLWGPYTEIMGLKWACSRGEECTCGRGRGQGMIHFRWQSKPCLLVSHLESQGSCIVSFISQAYMGSHPEEPYYLLDTRLDARASVKRHVGQKQSHG